MDIPEHLGRIVAQRSGNVDIPVQVDSHDGLELPEGKYDRTLGIVDIRYCVGHYRLGPCIFKFGSFLGIEPFLRLDEILHGVLIYVLVYVERLLGQQDRKESLLNLGDHVQP